MIKIKKRFKRSGFHHKQLKRIGKVAIYSRWAHYRGEQWPHYEVVKIGSHKGYYANTQYIESAETYPGASLWGIQGWTYVTLDKAERKFKRICKRFNKQETLVYA